MCKLKAFRTRTHYIPVREVRNASCSQPLNLFFFFFIAAWTRCIFNWVPVTDMLVSSSSALLQRGMTSVGLTAFMRNDVMDRQYWRNGLNETFSSYKCTTFSRIPYKKNVTLSTWSDGGKKLGQVLRLYLKQDGGETADWKSGRCRRRESHLRGLWLPEWKRGRGALPWIPVNWSSRKRVNSCFSDPLCPAG